MVLLSDLPKEVIVAITNLLQAQSIGNLWLSGNSQMIKRLGDGGGVESFHFELDPIYRTCWPSIIRHFTQLRTFSIDALEHIYKPRWNLNFLDLSHTIRQIRLNFDNALSHFVVATSTSPTLFPNLEELTAYDVDIKHASKLLNFLKNRDNFSILRLYVTAPYDLRPSDLPRNLHELEMWPINVVLEDGDRFPASLEILHASQFSFDVSPLPSGLRTLHLTLMDGKDSSDWTLMHIGALPRGLTSLTFFYAEIDETFFWALPRTLTYLEIPESIPIEYLEFVTRHLPRLTNLSVAGDHFENIKIFPSLLHTISGVKYHDSLFPLLPLSLRELHFGRTYGLDASKNWPHPLPPNLTVVSELWTSYLDCQPLPPRMMELYLTGGPFTSDQAQKLPQTLTHLAVDRVSLLNHDFIHHLPKSLLVLQAYTMSATPLLLTEEHIKSFPPHLVHLSLGPVELSHPDIFADLPNTLNLIRMCFESLPEDCVQHIPNGVRFLYLHCIHEQPGLTKKVLQSLPRKLVHFSLNIQHSLGDLTDEDLEHLPPALLTASLPKAPLVTGSCLPHLPSFLRSLQFAYSTPEWFKKA